MALNEFAKQELELAGLLSPEEDFYGGETGKAVLELISVFSKQGHSGMSAPLVADIFWKLANYKCLTPITGENSEWNEIDMESGILQNKRCYSLFKTLEGSVEFGNAIVFVDPDGNSWTGKCWLTENDCLIDNKSKKISSSQKIKGFPFTPKTFRVQVKQVEISNEIYSVIKDLEDLEQVKEWYLLN